MEEFLFANKTFFKFMFVRHPMQRMLSCYMDKMVKSNHEKLPPFRHYVRNKGRQIIQDRLVHQFLRKYAPEVAQNGSAISASRKLLSIDAGNGHNDSLGQQQEASSGMPNITPTFEEFLEFVLSTDLQGCLLF